MQNLEEIVWLSSEQAYVLYWSSELKTESAWYKRRTIIVQENLRGIIV